MAIDKKKFSEAKENLKSYAGEPESVTFEKKPAGKKLTKRDTHKVYSFWANKEQIEVWKCYQKASNTLKKAEDLGLEAITEYIKNHPLQGKEKEKYEIFLEEENLENSEYR